MGWETPITLVSFGLPYNHTKSSNFLRNLTKEFTSNDSGIADYSFGGDQLSAIHQSGTSLTELQCWLGSTIPDLPVFHFDPSGTTAEQVKQANSIVQHLSANQPVKRPNCPSTVGEI